MYYWTTWNRILLKCSLWIEFNIAVSLNATRFKICPLQQLCYYSRRILAFQFIILDYLMMLCHKSINIHILDVCLLFFLSFVYFKRNEIQLFESMLDANANSMADNCDFYCTNFSLHQFELWIQTVKYISMDFYEKLKQKTYTLIRWFT